MLYGTGLSAATPSEREIGVDEAKALVIAALDPQQRKLPNLEAIPRDYPDWPRFQLFTITWKGLRHGNAVIGNYAVDLYTGDVFSATRECHEEKNKLLMALQAQARARIHLSPMNYRRVRTGGPLCD